MKKFNHNKLTILSMDLGFFNECIDDNDGLRSPYVHIKASLFGTIYTAQWTGGKYVLINDYNIDENFKGIIEDEIYEAFIKTKKYEELYCKYVDVFKQDKIEFYEKGILDFLKDVYEECK